MCNYVEQIHETLGGGDSGKIWQWTESHLVINVRIFHYSVGGCLEFSRAVARPARQSNLRRRGPEAWLPL